MRSCRSFIAWAIVCIVGAGVLQSCQSLREIAALRTVNFALDRVDDAELAGVAVQRLRSYEDLRASDIARIGGAVANGEMPLKFNLFVAARNPEENEVQARMVRMAWTLLIQDRETVSGTITESFTLPPGEVRYIPVGIEVDLVKFFDDNVRDLVELALSISGGEGGEPKNIKLEAVPRIDTPLGAIDYPSPITIVSGDLGRAPAGS